MYSYRILNRKIILSSLIFSAFVAVLDVVEYFMQQIHNKVPFSDDGQDLGNGLKVFGINAAAAPSVLTFSSIFNQASTTFTVHGNVITTITAWMAKRRRPYGMQ